jgi:hypothetical protein
MAFAPTAAPGSGDVIMAAISVTGTDRPKYLRRVVNDVIVAVISDNRDW